MSTQRVKSIEPPYSSQAQESFSIVMPAGVEPLNIFRAVGNNERVLSRMVKGGLLDKGSVSVAQRELVILRACAVCNAEYEWGVHVAAYAAKAGFTQEQIADTCSDRVDPKIWAPDQLSLVNMVDELHQKAKISDELWQELRLSYSDEQLIELIMLAGLYHAVSFVVNGLRIEHEKFAPRFPRAET